MVRRQFQRWSFLFAIQSFRKGYRSERRISKPAVIRGRALSSPIAGESGIFIRFHCSPIQFTEGDNFRVVIQSIRRERVPWLCDLHLQKGRESSEHSTQAPIEKTSFHEQLLKQACYLVLRHSPFRFRGSLKKLWPRSPARFVRYQQREAKGVQGPSVTLSVGSGSCRDMATLMLEALRSLGFPARFASGYLECSASEAGRASTHAWAEAYLPSVGWVGYDPMLGEATSGQHIVVGVSNHPRAVMPVSGTFFGEQSSFLGMQVAVQTARFVDLENSSYLLKKLET